VSAPPLVLRIYGFLTGRWFGWGRNSTLRERKVR
jgi:hypothetical protein